MPARKPAYLQREALIQAALEAAEHIPPARITARMLAARAKLPQHSVMEQFGSLDRLVETLQTLHYEAARNHTLAAIGGQAVGTERILVAAKAYLDFAFTHRGLRSWMSLVRLRTPAMQAQWQADNRLYAQFVASEFALTGWPNPLPGARLFIAAILALVRYEQQQGRKLPASRRCLERFLRIHQCEPRLV